MHLGYKDLRCGLIGRQLSHSFSKIIHEMLADYSFELIELEPEELCDFVKSGSLDAFCVTIPYKKDMIPLLDHVSEEALAIGAVNVVVRDANGKLHGYNTDYFGFDYTLSLSGLSATGKKALVFGRGGAAATVVALLRDRGCREVVTLGSRDNLPDNRRLHSDAEIIVNASPVGMYPNNYASPCDLSEFPECLAVFDLIYNPARTELMMSAARSGVPCFGGLNMLVAQAARAFELFTGAECDPKAVGDVVASISADTENLILVGMPGCGKSSVGAAVAMKLGREFVDADEEFERMHSISPADAINTLGEDSFREMESATLAKICKNCSRVIATGGGAVTRERNYPLMHQNGFIVFIERELDKLERGGRPLSQRTPIGKLYESRIDAYRAFSDACVTSDESIDTTADAVIAEFNRHFAKEQK